MDLRITNGLLRAMISSFGRLTMFALICATALHTAFGENPSAQWVKPAGMAFNRAQELDWISNDQFAVGRWDGSISIFRTPKSGEYGPVIVQAMAVPSGRGVEMLAAVDDLTLLSSNSADRLAVWKRKSSSAPFSLSEDLTYDSQYGVANSAAVMKVDHKELLITGHESGNILIWTRDEAGQFKMTAHRDLHSAHPIPSQYPLRNVRGLVPWRQIYVIAGSEDGDLVGLRLPEGNEVFRIRYSQAAQRGINSLSLLGDWLLVANCSVGPTDKNIWLYDLTSGQPVLKDSSNLELDTGRSQVFNFDAVLLKSKLGLGFVSSTEEGLLWEGQVSDGHLIVTGVTRIAPDGGAALRWNSHNALLGTAAYQIGVFQTQ